MTVVSCVRSKTSLADDRTPVIGWQRTVIHQGFQTYGVSLNRPPVASGTIVGLEDSKVTISQGVSLAESTAYYLEILSGSYEGHRFEVNDMESAGAKIAVTLDSVRSTLQALPSGLTNADFLIRPHWTLDNVFPKSALSGGNDVATADQILCFNGMSYDTYYLLQQGNFNHWTGLSDSTLSVADRRILGPGEGTILSKPTSGVSELLTIGHVRRTAFRQSLKQGYQLVCGGYPVETTPFGRGLTTDNGFIAGTTPEEADEVPPN